MCGVRLFVCVCVLFVSVLAFRGLFYLPPFISFFPSIYLPVYAQMAAKSTQNYRFLATFLTAFYRLSKMENRKVRVSLAVCLLCADLGECASEGGAC